MGSGPGQDTGTPGSGTRVEPDGVTGFADEVRTENKETLKRQSGGVTTDFGQGIPFGKRSPSSAVLAAKEMYRRSMVQAINTLEGYIEAADVLADAADAVAKTYRNADAMSAATSEDVRQALRDAVIKARQLEQRSAGGGARRAI